MTNTDMAEKSLATVNKELDHLVEDYFGTLDEILVQQRELENYMKNGFLYMSNARKSMGFKQLGSAQYDLGSMKADFCVDVTETDTDDVRFCKHMDCKKTESDSSSCQEENGLRKRTTKSPNYEENNADELVQSVKNLKVQDLPENGIVKKDPITMFGVLVPQALKQSQARFRTALDLSVSLSSLRAKLLTLKANYLKLLEQKKNIVKSTNVSNSIQDD